MKGCGLSLILEHTVTLDHQKAQTLDLRPQFTV